MEGRLLLAPQWSENAVQKGSGCLPLFPWVTSREVVSCTRTWAHNQCGYRNAKVMKTSIKLDKGKPGETAHRKCGGLPRDAFASISFLNVLCSKLFLQWLHIQMHNIAIQVETLPLCIFSSHAISSIYPKEPFPYQRVNTNNHMPIIYTHPSLHISYFIYHISYCMLMDSCHTGAYMYPLCDA